MNYVAYHILPKIIQGLSADESAEILLAELQDLPFESFEQTEKEVVGYVQQRFDSQELNYLIANHPLVVDVIREEIPYQNWNEVWESAYQPVEINKQVRIRALFHSPDPSFVHELVIQPKMSFGTGHHATTRLILEELATQPPVGLHVLDMGCGTSILGILAAKLGASWVDAVDNDPRCVENSIENAKLNDCNNLSVVLLENFVPYRDYDLIIANIQRNVLLEQMPFYAQLSHRGTSLWLSGIMEHDAEVVIACAKDHNFHLVKEKKLSPWVLLITEKSD